MNVGGLVGMQIRGGSDVCRPPMRISYIACKISASGSVTASVSKSDSVAAWARNSSTGPVPVSISAADVRSAA